MPGWKAIGCALLYQSVNAMRLALDFVQRVRCLCTRLIGDGAQWIRGLVRSEQVTVDRPLSGLVDGAGVVAVRGVVAVLEVEFDGLARGVGQG